MQVLVIGILMLLENKIKARKRFTQEIANIKGKHGNFRQILEGIIIARANKGQDRGKD